MPCTAEDLNNNSSKVEAHQDNSTLLLLNNNSNNSNNILDLNLIRLSDLIIIKLLHHHQVTVQGTLLMSKDH